MTTGLPSISLIMSPALMPALSAAESGATVPTVGGGVDRCPAGLQRCRAGRAAASTGFFLVPLSSRQHAVTSSSGMAKPMPESYHSKPAVSPSARGEAGTRTPMHAAVEVDERPAVVDRRHLGVGLDRLAPDAVDGADDADRLTDGGWSGLAVERAARGRRPTGRSRSRPSGRPPAPAAVLRRRS